MQWTKRLSSYEEFKLRKRIGKSKNWEAEPTDKI